MNKSEAEKVLKPLVHSQVMIQKDSSNEHHCDDQPKEMSARNWACCETETWKRKGLSTGLVISKRLKEQLHVQASFRKNHVIQKNSQVYNVRTRFPAMYFVIRYDLILLTLIVTVVSQCWCRRRSLVCGWNPEVWAIHSELTWSTRVKAQLVHFSWTMQFLK